MIKLVSWFAYFGITLVLGGCSQLPSPNTIPASDQCPAAVQPDCTFEVSGACVVVTDSIPECGTDHSELLAETESALTIAGKYWSTPTAILNGWTLTVYPDAVLCGEVMAGGCTYSNGCNQIEATVLGGCYQSLLVHEFGHAVISDWEHHDPRWAYWNGPEERWCSIEGLIP